MSSIFVSWVMMILILLAVLSVSLCAAIDDSDDYHLPRRKRSTVSLNEGNECRTLSDEPGICKRITSCQEYMQRLRSKTIAYNSIFRCGFIGFTEVICCPLRNTQISTIPRVEISTEDPLPRSTPVINNGSPTPITPPRTATGTASRTTPRTNNPNERPAQAACREWRNLDPASTTPHIVGGHAVPPGVFAHMGALMEVSEEGGKRDLFVICGSSLIAKQHVLTAAHCVSDELFRPTFVRFGMVELNSEENLPDDYEIQEFHIHPDYRTAMKYHDIAILKLKRSVSFTIIVRPACLFSDMIDIDSTTPLVVLGWGVVDIQTRARSESLQMTNLTTIPLSRCNTSYHAFGVGRSYIRGISEGQYCAYDAKLERDACQADSGGPLQFVQDKKSTIVGVVSFGALCGSLVPSVYTRVAFYLDWIEKLVWPS